LQAEELTSMSKRVTFIYRNYVVEKALKPALVCS